MNGFENKPRWTGYQPKGPRMDVKNPPQGGSGVPSRIPDPNLNPPRYDTVTEGYDPKKVRNSSRILTTPEKIVHEFRLGDRGIQIHYAKEKTSFFERAIQIFLIFAFGWLFGYLHHFLVTSR